MKRFAIAAVLAFFAAGALAAQEYSPMFEGGSTVNIGFGFHPEWLLFFNHVSLRAGLDAGRISQISPENSYGYTFDAVLTFEPRFYFAKNSLNKFFVGLPLEAGTANVPYSLPATEYYGTWNYSYGVKVGFKWVMIDFAVNDIPAWITLEPFVSYTVTWYDNANFIASYGTADYWRLGVYLNFDLPLFPGTKKGTPALHGTVTNRSLTNVTRVTNTPASAAATNAASGQ